MLTNYTLKVQNEIRIRHRQALYKGGLLVKTPTRAASRESPFEKSEGFFVFYTCDFLFIEQFIRNVKNRNTGDFISGLHGQLVVCMLDKEFSCFSFITFHTFDPSL
ncbi:hypothetical protein ACV07N_07495 [Roseivirga echinicomitans]